MKTWTAQDWAIFLGAIGTLFGAINNARIGGLSKTADNHEVRLTEQDKQITKVALATPAVVVPIAPTEGERP